MRRVPLLLLFMLVTLSATLVCADDNPLPKPGVFGEENILTSTRLSKYDTIIIKDFDAKNPELENIDEKEKSDTDAIKGSLPGIISASFVNEMKSQNKFKNVLVNSNKKENAVIVEGKITKLSGGHGAAKIFLGWMAPQSSKTHIEVTGRLIDAKTGKELAVFSDVKSGSSGSAMGFIKEVMSIIASEFGKDLANFAGKLY